MAVVTANIDATLAAGLDKTTNSINAGNIIAVNSRAFESAAGDSDTSVYVVFPMRSNAVPMPGGKVYHDSITNGTGFTYGLYEYVSGVLTDVDENLFKASATHANTTTNDPFELAMTVDNAGKMLWELLALTADPQKTYYWCLTGATVGDGGTFNVQCTYVQPF